MNHWLIFGDTHLSRHSADAIGVVFETVERLKPKRISIIGDIGDFGRISAFAMKGDELGVLTTAQEVWLVRQFLIHLREIAGEDCQIDVIGGNHGKPRWTSYINKNAREMAPLLPLFEDAIGVHEIGANWVEHNDLLNEGGYLIRHGKKYGVYAVRQSLWRSGGNSHIQGHSHRLKLWSQRNTDNSFVFAIEAGCLCNLDCVYDRGDKYADWQHGFVVLTQSKAGSTWLPSIWPIVKKGSRMECHCMGIDVGEGAGKGRRFFNDCALQITRETESKLLEALVGAA